MSDLDIVLQEIEDRQSIISTAIYSAKRKCNLEALEVISELLDTLIDDLALKNILE